MFAIAVSCSLGKKKKMIGGPEVQGTGRRGFDWSGVYRGPCNPRFDRSRGCAGRAEGRNRRLERAGARIDARGLGLRGT